MNDEKPGIWRSIKSVMAAFFGVQSEKNRQRDFSQGNYGQFIVFGFIGTLLFVLIMWGVVKLILSAAS